MLTTGTAYDITSHGDAKSVAKRTMGRTRQKVPKENTVVSKRPLLRDRGQFYWHGVVLCYHVICVILLIAASNSGDMAGDVGGDHEGDEGEVDDGEHVMVNTPEELRRVLSGPYLKGARYINYSVCKMSYL